MCRRIKSFIPRFMTGIWGDRVAQSSSILLTVAPRDRYESDTRDYPDEALSLPLLGTSVRISRPPKAAAAPYRSSLEEKGRSWLHVLLQRFAVRVHVESHHPEKSSCSNALLHAEKLSWLHVLLDAEKSSPRSNLCGRQKRQFADRVRVKVMLFSANVDCLSISGSTWQSR